ncbi:unnamed protein product [Pleuronectes platessa]|uniref:Uncharacterized protein n=1 Tax=Pleuronectes platessa TaxID=8262 RepID=A0A9N7UAY8_PLEPL|nr:unnamed protein product [Pleuronectes platessa]
MSFSTPGHTCQHQSVGGVTQPSEEGGEEPSLSGSGTDVFVRTILSLHLAEWGHSDLSSLSVPRVMDNIKGTNIQCLLNNLELITVVVSITPITPITRLQLHRWFEKCKTILVSGVQVGDSNGFPVLHLEKSSARRNDNSLPGVQETDSHTQASTCEKLRNSDEGAPQ